MKKKLDIDNVDQLTSVANELFENIEITEEDFVDQFDSHLPKKAPELFSRKEDLLNLGSSCIRYEPCPICYKCRVKGSHIYAKCDNCPIDLCIHKDEHINRFIVRDNFSVNMPEEIAVELDKKVVEALGVPKELLTKNK